MLTWNRWKTPLSFFLTSSVLDGLKSSVPLRAGRTSWPTFYVLYPIFNTYSKTMWNCLMFSNQTWSQRSSCLNQLTLTLKISNRVEYYYEPFKSSLWSSASNIMGHKNIKCTWDLSRWYKLAKKEGQSTSFGLNFIPKSYLEVDSFVCKYLKVTKCHWHRETVSSIFSI